MQTRRLAYAFGWVALLVGVALMAKFFDTRPAESEPWRVVFLGRIAPAQDPRYQHFVAALEALSPDLRQRIDLRFVRSLTEGPPRIEPALDEALALRPAVIIAPYADAAKALRRRQGKTPVIFRTLLDPIRAGVVSSITSRPEPMTGVSVSDLLDAKRLELLHDAYPRARRIAVLMDRDWGEDTEASLRLPTLAKSLGLELTLLYAEDRAEAELVLDAPASRAFDAWCLPPTGLAGLNSDYILGRLRSWDKPVIVGRLQDVEQGVPLAYFADHDFVWHAMVELLMRVLQGEPAGSIPVQRPHRTVLAVRPLPLAGFPAPAVPVIQRADVVFP